MRETMHQALDNGAPDAAHSPSAASVGKSEDLMVEHRRNLLNFDDRSMDDARCGLALSGGGIRSATFSLGVLQAIAEAQVAHTHQPEPNSVPGQTFRASLLSTFDYLSTVSGGGYLGAFLCSLFRPGRLRQATAPVTAGKDAMLSAADDATRVLSGGAPGRMRSSADYSGDRILRAPLAWLRENGRYLTPSGSGDALYAAALAIRNWIAVHCVIGTLLTALVALMVTARAFIAGLSPSYLELEQKLLANATIRADTSSFALVWWSPLWVACILPLATVGVGLGAAYWLVEERKGQASGVASSHSAWAMLMVAVVGLVVSASVASGARDLIWPSVTLQYSGLNEARQGDARRLSLLLFISSECLIAWVAYVITALAYKGASSRRVALTRGAQLILTLSIVLSVLALVDTLGQTLYLASKQRQLSAALSPAAIAAGLVWLARRLAGKDAFPLPGFVSKLPLSALAGLAGVVIFVIVGAIWAAFVHWVIWGGNQPNVKTLFVGTQPFLAASTLGITFVLALLNGFFPGFINMSSLQALYAARLTRAYLGASNGERFRSAATAARSAAEPIDSDRVLMSDYYADGRVKTVAPLHIINVTVNKTVDPAEQLVQRDRKGQPLAVLPCGIAFDGPDVEDFPSFSGKRGFFSSSVEREMDVGEWIATSGAAVSTGIGRQTTLGTSLLLGAANVRLGTWWPTGRGRTDTVRLPFSQKGATAPPWLQHVGAIFRTQRYLSYELRAAFHGTHRAWQYLSDGGHFENTAMYELLRPERRVGKIFACDSGADPTYEFRDLANLIRLVKIDLRITVRIVDPATIDLANTKLKPLAGLFGTPSTFKSGPVDQAPAALLLYAKGEDQKLVQIVVIKPHIKPEVALDAPADVLQYAATHAPFPQQPTSNQFFDEAQWESYRALGHWQGMRLFNPEVLAALDAHAQLMQNDAKRANSPVQ